MIPTKSTKKGAVDVALGTNSKSYMQRQKQKKVDAKKDALKDLEGVATSKEKEKLSTVLESIITMIVEQELEKSSDDIFGDHLFGDQRTDSPAKDEKNTPEEDEFLDSLVSWILNMKPEGLKGTFSQVWQQVQQGKYTDLLKPNENRHVYRLVHGAEVANIFGLKNNPIYKEKMRQLQDGEDLNKIFDEIPFIVDLQKANSRSGIQSWGIEPLILQGFMKQGEVAILMKTSPSPSHGKFLVNPYEMTTMLKPTDSDQKAMIDMLSSEGEVISFGDVKIEAATAVFMSPDTIGVGARRRILSKMYSLMENEE